jgi:hypothetical protein
LSDFAVDPVRLPRTAAYLASLPEGLESFAACKVRDITVEPYARSFGSLAGEPGLPRPVSDMLAGRFAGAWLPEAVFQVVHLVVRDCAFDDDAPFHEWLLKANEQVFDKPILRNLMRLVSPTLIVLGATRRWSTFHTGSELSAARVVVAGDRSETVARLQYPAGLFPWPFLLGLEQSFIAGLAASRARDARVKLLAGDGADGASGEARYAVSWKA